MTDALAVGSNQLNVDNDEDENGTIFLPQRVLLSLFAAPLLVSYRRLTGARRRWQVVWQLEDR